jgi:Co/Zn/Cd efflux system component
MKKGAFGAIDLLIGLVITAFVFLIGMNAMKGLSSINLNGNSVDTKSVQEHVDEQVNEIENMRQQTINYQQNVQNVDY